MFGGNIPKLRHLLPNEIYLKCFLVCARREWFTAYVTSGSRGST
jgi:hypothetical protein